MGHKLSFLVKSFLIPLVFFSVFSVGDSARAASLCNQSEKKFLTIGEQYYEHTHSNGTTIRIDKKPLLNPTHELYTSSRCRGNQSLSEFFFYDSPSNNTISGVVPYGHTFIDYKTFEITNVTSGNSFDFEESYGLLPYTSYLPYFKIVDSVPDPNARLSEYPYNIWTVGGENIQMRTFLTQPFATNISSEIASDAIVPATCTGEPDGSVKCTIDISREELIALESNPNNKYKMNIKVKFDAEPQMYHFQAVMGYPEQEGFKTFAKVPTPKYTGQSILIKVCSAQGAGACKPTEPTPPTPSEYHTFNVRSSGVQGVRITASNTMYNGTTNYIATLGVSDSVTLTAPANVRGRSFTDWTGCNSTDAAARTCTILGDAHETPSQVNVSTVTANYISIPITRAEVNLETSSKSVDSGDTITLSWSVGGEMEKCVAGGGWRGSKDPNGGSEEVTVNFTSGRPLKLFTLSCESGVARGTEAITTGTDYVMISETTMNHYGKTRASLSLSDAQASEDCDEEGNCKVPKNLLSLPLSDNDSLKMGLFLFTLLGSLLILILLYMKGKNKKTSKKE